MDDDCANCKQSAKLIGDFCRYCWDVEKAHYCYEWDGLLINKNHPEFECCTCGDKDG